MGSHNSGVNVWLCILTEFFPCLLYVFYLKYIVYVLVTNVTPDWFLPVDGFPYNWSLCHFTLKATGLIENWNFGILHFRDIGMC